MSVEIIKYHLSEICTDVSYGYTESANKEIVGPKFLRITDIQGGVVNWDEVPYCPIDDDRIDKYRLIHGDIVVARTGNSTGENYVYKGEEPSVFASYLIRFQVDTTKANPFFVWYQMRTRRWWDFVRGAKGGSAQAGANAKVLGSFEVFLPPLVEQNEIANQLEKIDNKIELNRQINQTLEQITQAIFKSWFVDFEPVKAKIEAKQNGQDPERAAMYAISGKTEAELEQLPAEQYGQLSTAAAFFPTELEKSDLGLIPRGWEWRSLYNTSTFINGAAFKSTEFSIDNKGLPVVKIAELKYGITSQTKFTKGEFSKKYLIDNDEVLYSWSGSPSTSLEVFKWFGGKGWLNQHIFRVLPESEASKYFVFFLLRHLKPTLISIATDKQTTGLGHVTVADMKRLMIPFPEKGLLNRFAEIVRPLYEESSNHEKQSSTLSELRNTLLPRLLSGKLTLHQNESGPLGM